MSSDRRPHASTRKRPGIVLTTLTTLVMTEMVKALLIPEFLKYEVPIGSVSLYRYVWDNLLTIIEDEIDAGKLLETLQADAGNLSFPNGRSKACKVRGLTDVHLKFVVR